MSIGCRICGSVFFWGDFHNLATKKKGWQIQRRDFQDLKKNRHILTKKTLKVAIFRQCVSVGRPNKAGFPKKSISPSGQSPFTAN
jgi:hypothetical protein